MVAGDLSSLPTLVRSQLVAERGFQLNDGSDFYRARRSRESVVEILLLAGQLAELDRGPWSARICQPRELNDPFAT